MSGYDKGENSAASSSKNLILHHLWGFFPYGNIWVYEQSPFYEENV